MLPARLNPSFPEPSETVRAPTGPASSSPTGPAPRLCELDGIRGWAALSVLVFHLAWELFGAVLPAFRTPALRFLLDGNLAVCVFFVLSGDALSLGFTSLGGRGVSASMIAKRYFRLVGPIFFSCAIVWMLMHFGWVHAHAAAPRVQSEEWLGSFLRFEESLRSLFGYGMLGVFVKTDGEVSYNPFLWPMGLELIGSLIVFAVGSIWTRLRAPATVLGVSAAWLALLGSNLSLFFLGMLYGVLRARGFFVQVQKLRLNRVLIAMMLAGLVLLDPLADAWSIRSHRLLILMAALTVFACYGSADIIRFMSNPLSSFLGRVSFPMYVLHFAVLVSLTSWMIVAGEPVFGLTIEFALGVIAISVVVALLAATIAERLERHYLRLVDRCIRRIMLP